MCLCEFPCSWGKLWWQLAQNDVSLFVNKSFQSFFFFFFFFFTHSCKGVPSLAYVSCKIGALLSVKSTFRVKTTCTLDWLHLRFDSWCSFTFYLWGSHSDLTQTAPSHCIAGEVWTLKNTSSYRFRTKITTSVLRLVLEYCILLQTEWY